MRRGIAVVLTAFVGLVIACNSGPPDSTQREFAASLNAAKYTDGDETIQPEDISKARKTRDTYKWVGGGPGKPDRRVKDTTHTYFEYIFMANVSGCTVKLRRVDGDPTFYAVKLGFNTNPTGLGRNPSRADTLKVIIQMHKMGDLACYNPKKK